MGGAALGGCKPHRANKGIEKVNESNDGLVLRSFRINASLLRVYSNNKVVLYNLHDRLVLLMF